MPHSLLPPARHRLELKMQELLSESHDSPHAPVGVILFFWGKPGRHIACPPWRPTFSPSVTCLKKSLVQRCKEDASCRNGITSRAAALKSIESNLSCSAWRNPASPRTSPSCKKPVWARRASDPEFPSSLSPSRNAGQPSYVSTWICLREVIQKSRIQLRNILRVDAQILVKELLHFP